MSESTSVRAARHLSVAGLIAMSAGLGLALWEFWTEYIQGRLGPVGHYTVLICGTFFSVWGLKEVIASFWPQLSRAGIGRHRFALPVEGRIYLMIMFVLFIGSLLGRSNPLMMVFSLMAGPFVINGWLTFTILKKLRVERVSPERMMAGDAVSVEIALENPKRFISAWLMSVRDRVSNGQEVLYPTVVLTRVPPRGSGKGFYRLQLVHRGVYEFGPIQANTRFPLGLVERGLVIHSFDRILVHPRIGRLTSAWRLKLESATELATDRTSRGGPFDDEFHKMREYRHGDDPRAIHWKTSARRNELMVREFQESRRQELIILLDAWRPRNADTAQHRRTEEAIALATTICTHQLRKSREAHPLFFAAGQERFDWGGHDGSHHLEFLLDALALLEPSADPDLGAMLADCLTVATSRHRVLMITPRSRECEKAIQSWSRENLSQRSRLVQGIEMIGSDTEEFQRIVNWE